MNVDRHERFKQQLNRMHDRGIRRTIRSLRRNIASHEQKIVNEPTSRAVRHWQKEIIVWQEQLNLVIREAQRREIYDGKE